MVPNFGMALKLQDPYVPGFPFPLVSVTVTFKLGTLFSVAGWNWTLAVSARAVPAPRPKTAVTARPAAERTRVFIGLQGFKMLPFCGRGPPYVSSQASKSAERGSARHAAGQKAFRGLSVALGNVAASDLGEELVRSTGRWGARQLDGGVESVQSWARLWRRALLHRPAIGRGVGPEHSWTCQRGRLRLALARTARQDWAVRFDWWTIPVGIVFALMVIWLILAVTLWVLKPDMARMQDYLRLLPDLLRLLKRLTVDPQMPWRIRLGLVLVLAFVASPIDLIPDVIPVIGFADDVLLIALVLRWINRTAGRDALARQWPGTPDGLATLLKLCGLGHRAE